MGILPELFFSFARIGAFTFGGGYAMLSLLEHECVEKKQWLTSDELAEVTVIAESTPGTIAINCATYTGLKQAGMKGALTATLGIVLPSFLVLLLISAFLQNAMTIPVVAKALKGIRVAVVLLILRAGINMLRSILKKTPDKKTVLIFFGIFLTLTLFSLLLAWRIPTILMILASGAMGYEPFSRKRAAK
ncbi:MAG: chromate transporter [Clostridia bacterium]|nr:chromate transporter [Clostridia bacterium]